MKTKTMSDQDGKGGCFCGGIKFTFKNPVTSIGHCHCTICQKIHGAAFVTWASVFKKNVKIVDANGLLNWFDSSEKAQRGFCRQCGSHLFFQPKNNPDEIHIALAVISTKIRQKPQLHGCYDKAVDWFRVEDTLPKKSFKE